MCVVEDTLAWLCVVGKGKRLVGTGSASMQTKLLPIVTGIVVDRLDHGSIRPNEPVSGPQGMFESDIFIFGITGFTARPPQKLEVHHRIDDGVVSVFSPGGNQLRGWVVHIKEVICAANRAVSELLIMNQLITGHGRIEVKEASIVILLRFLPQHWGCPKLRPSAIFLVVSARIHLPQFTYPEPTSPEESFLGFPFSRLVVAIRKESGTDRGADDANLIQLKIVLVFFRSAIYLLLEEIYCLLVCA